MSLLIANGKYLFVNGKVLLILALGGGSTLLNGK
jgi:hypothetical protein